MKRLIAIAATLAALATACAESGAQPLGPAPGNEPSPASASTTSPSGSSSEDQLPLIVVETPANGESVSSPVTVSGTANVFEATVSIAILDAEGRAVATTFTTATCGSGCRGTYSTEVRYEVDETQPGTVRVFEVSAEDGSSVNVVDIPVTLAA
jgi:hypothetical protein